MNKSISIITPSYNQGRFIERTIQSVLSQNIPNLEYVIIDGLSTDNTLEILKKYQTQTFWISEKDSGQTDAINKGINTTSGEIIGWLNSDDTYYPDSLNKVLDYFDRNPDIEIVYGMANYIDENDQLIMPYEVEEWNYERLLFTCFICQPAVFFRRSIFKKHGLLDETLQYCMDYEFWIRLAKANVTFGFLKETLAASRLHSDTKTLGSRLQVHCEIISMLKNVLGRAPDRWLSNYAHAVLERQSFIKKDSMSFCFFVPIISCYAGIKWNKTISRDMMKWSKEIWISLLKTYISNKLPVLKKIYRKLYSLISHIKNKFFSNKINPAPVLIDLPIIESIIEPIIEPTAEPIVEPIAPVFVYEESKKKYVSELKNNYIKNRKNIKLPKITIVTPSYNQGQFLENCINSVLEQDYENIEYIIIDGGSTDNSLEIMQKYSKQINYYVSEPDEGQTDAINKGFKMATGDIVTWLNSDDFYLHGALFEVAKSYLENSDASFYFGDGYRVNKDGSFKSNFFPERPVVFNRDLFMLGLNYILQPSAFINRKHLEITGELDITLKYGMDTDLFLRLSKLALPQFINEVLSCSREYESTKTSIGEFERIEELRQIAFKHSGYGITPGIICYFLDTLYKNCQKNPELFPEYYAKSIGGFWSSTSSLLESLNGRKDGFPKKSSEE